MSNIKELFEDIEMYKSQCKDKDKKLKEATDQLNEVKTKFEKL